MANKLTAAEKRRALLYSDFTDEELNDPRVDALLKQFKEAASRAPQGPDFSNVQSQSDTVPQPEEAQRPLLDALAGGLQSSASGLLRLGADGGQAIPGPLGELTEDVTNLAREHAPGLAALRDRIGLSLDQTSRELFDDAQANRQKTEGWIDEQPGGVRKVLQRGVLDVAQSPTSLLSVFGGPAAGGIAGTDVYAQEYNQGVMNGLTPEQARKRATALASVEAGMSSIPAGKFGSKLLRGSFLDDVWDATKSDARVLAERILRTTVGESAEEGATESLQIGVDALIAGNTEDDKLRSFAAANTVDAWGQIVRATIAGGVGGTALGSPVEAMHLAAEQGKRAADIARRAAHDINSRDAKRTNAIDVTPITPAPEQLDMFGTQDGASTFEAQEQQRRKELEVDAGLITGRRKARIEEGREARLEGIRSAIDLARQQQEPLQERVEALGERASEQDRSTLAAANRRVRALEAEYTAVQAQQAEARLAAQPKTPVTSKPEEQLDLFTGQEQAQLQAQKVGALSRRAEAKKLIASDNKAIDTQAKSMRAKSRRDFMKTLQVQTRDMNPDERADYIADATAAWENGNPLEEYIAKAKLPPAKKSTKSKGKKEPKLPLGDAVSNVAPADLLSKFDGLKQEVVEGKTPVTNKSNALEHVYGAMLSRVGQGDVKILNKLMENGKLRVVEDVAAIPTAKKLDPATTKGFYDGKHTYIVAGNVDSRNIVGDMLSIAAHETKHGADVSGNENLKGSFANLIGRDANTKLVKKIEALASKDNDVADIIVQLKKENSAGGVYDLELPAHFINVALERQNASTLTKRVLDDIVSAIRTGAKKRFGINDVNLGDVAYLARDLLKTVAAKNENIEGSVGSFLQDGRTDNLQMIGGRKGKGYNLAVMEDEAYNGRVDGKPRYEFTDHESTLNTNAVDYLKTRPTHGREPSTLLMNILKHGELYTQYPDAANVKVTVDRSKDNAGASYQSAGSTIYLSPDLLSTSADNIKSVLLHEVQHYIQDVEGHVGGTSPKNFIDQDIKARYEDASKALKDFLKKPIAENKRRLSEEQQEKLYKDTVRYNVKAREFAMKPTLQELTDREKHLFYTEYAKNSDDPVLQKLASDYAAIFSEHEDAVKASQKDEAKARRIYMTDYGEVEARTTQYRRNRTPDERAIFSPEDDMAFAYGKVPVEDTIDASKIAKGDEVVEPSSPDEGEAFRRSRNDGLTQTARDVTATPEFLKWFGNSVAVDESGNPQVYYTGTSKDKDFHAFNIPKNGVWFTTNPDEASQYAADNDSRRLVYTGGFNIEEINTSDRVFPVYLKAEKPYRMTSKDMDFLNSKPGYKRLQAQLFDQLRAEGYDSVLWPGGDTIVIIGKPTQIKSVNNSGNFAETGKNSTDVLAQTAPEGYSYGLAYRGLTRKLKVGNEGVGAVLRIGQRLLTSGGFLDSELREMIRHGSQLPASLMVRASKIGNDLLSALDTNAREIAKREGLTSDKVQQTLRVRLGKRLEEIDKMETKTERDAALDALDRTPEYRGVAAAVRGIRDFKMELTREIIALRARDPKPMTEKEVAIYTKMITNAERYTTRAYLATYNDQVGTRYGKGLWKRFQRDPSSPEGKIVQAALDWLKNNELIIPDEVSLHELPTPRLRRMYENWIGGAGGLKGDAGRRKRIRDLSNLPEPTQEMIESKAADIVKDLLNLNKSRGPISRHYSIGAKQNRTILEARKDLPAELRALMGEITDPVLREAISLQRMINLSSKTKLLTEVFEKGAANGWWSDVKTDDHETQLRDIAYGPMDGKWINANLTDALTGTLFSLESVDKAVADSIHNPNLFMQYMAGKSVRILSDMSRIQKTYRIVFSLAQMALNFGGSFHNIVLNGIINPKTAGKGLRDAGIALAAEINPALLTDKNLPKVQEIVRAGVLDSATVGEFKSQAYDLILQQIIKLDPDQEGYFANVRRVAWNVFMADGNFINAVRQMYAFMDVWTKVATYYDRKGFLNEFNKVEKMGWTEEYIQRRAGDEASGTNISYERAIPIAKIIEKNLPIGMFLTYFTEVPRTIVTSMGQALSDANMARNAKTAKGRAMAAQKAVTRMAGTLAVTAGVIKLTTHMIDKDDEDEEKRRRLWPEWMQSKWTLPTGIDKEGNAVYFEINRFDPNGPLNEAITSIIVAPEDQKGEAAFQAVAGLFVEARGAIQAWQVLWDMGVETAVRLSGDENYWDKDKPSKRTVLERNYPEHFAKIRNMLSYGDLGENLIATVEALYLPASLQPAIDSKGEVAKVRENDTNLHNIPHSMGYRPFVDNPDESFGFRVRDYNSALKQIRKDRSKLLDVAPSLSEGELVERVTDLVSREKKAFDELRYVLEGYMAHDRSLKQAAQHFDSNKLFSQVRYNKFQPSMLSKESLKRWAKEQIREGRDRTEVRKVYNLMRRVYGDIDTSEI